MHGTSPERRLVAQLLARLLRESDCDRADLGWTDALFPAAGFVPVLPFGCGGSPRRERRPHRVLQLFRAGDERWGIRLAGRGSQGRAVDGLAYWVGGSFAAILDSQRPNPASTDEPFRYLAFVLATCRWSGYQGLDESAKAIPRPDCVPEHAAGLFDRVWSSLGSPLPWLGRSVEELAAWLVSRGMLEDAAVLYAEAYEIAVFADLPGPGMDAAAGAAFALRRDAQWDAAERWYALAGEIAAFCEDWSRLSWITSGRATLVADRGAHPKARQMYHEALALGIVADDGPAQARAHLSLSVLDAWAEEWDTAASHAWSAFRLHTDPARQAEAGLTLGYVFQRTGHLQTSVRAYQVVLSMSDEVDTRALALGGMSQSYAMAGDREAFEDASARLWALDGVSARNRSQCLEGRVRALLALGDPRFGAAAAEAIGFAELHGYSREVVTVERLIEEAREGLPARVDTAPLRCAEDIDAGLREIAAQLPPSGRW